MVILKAGFCIVFLICVLFFSDLFGARFIFTERDLAPYFIPPRFFFVSSIKNGDFPLWNPYQYCGHPFFANPQNAVLYPLNIIFFIFPFDIAFNWIIILHFFLAGFFFYLLLRDLKTSHFASLVSGLIFMLSGLLLSLHSTLNCLLSIIWTPLIIMFFNRAIKKPGFKNEILTAIFSTISFLGGGLEIVYGNFLILLFITIFSKNGMTGFKSLFKTIVFFIISSAIQLIPFLELYKYSIRGTGLSYTEATTWSFSPKDIVLFFFTDPYGYFLKQEKYWENQCWFKTLYTGSSPFILSFFYFRFNKKRGLYLFLIILSIFIALGRYNPIYNLIYRFIPFFKGLRYPVKFIYIFIITLTITAGLGCQTVLERQISKRLFLILSLITSIAWLIVILFQTQIGLFLKTKGIDFPNWNYIFINLHHLKRLLFYLFIFFLLIWIGLEFKWRWWTKVLLITSLILDLFGNMGFYGKERWDEYIKKPEPIEMIEEGLSLHNDLYGRLFSTPKTISLNTKIPIYGLNNIKLRHLPTLSQLYRLHNIWGIDVICLKRVAELYNAFTKTPSISTTNLIDLYGIRYVISVLSVKDPRFKLLKRKIIKLYEYTQAKPTVFLVDRYKVLQQKDIIPYMVKKDFNPISEVILEEEPSLLIRGSGKVEIISETNNRLTLRVNAKENTILVTTYTYYPGWKVYVDGIHKKLYRADYTFRAVEVEKGSHNVEFVYRPISFILGLWITTLGLLSLLVIPGLNICCNISFKTHRRYEG